jgi:uncharacterized protein
MMIKREYSDLSRYLTQGKALIIHGPRQVGKTTLLKNWLSGISMKSRFVTGDDISVQTTLGSRDLRMIREYVEGYEILAIDEAHRIPGIGTGIKILVDQVPNLHVIATGSSSFELAGQIGEPLTGRKTTLHLHPIALSELSGMMNRSEMKDNFEKFLIFGLYPEIVTASNADQRKKLLIELVDSYLLRDILELDRVKSAKVVLDLLRLVAFQVGSEVSLSELGTQIGLDTKTVIRYLDLFEKSFILYSLRGYSRNLRKEVTKKSKYYFYDNGIRNAVISNFNPLSHRDDTGRLWENFLFMERLKKRDYSWIHSNVFFWRTYDGAEIDLVEERDGLLYGYEFKWGRARTHEPKDWKTSYPEAHYEVIDQDSFADFIL